MSWNSKVKGLSSLLEGMSATCDGAPVEPDAAYARWTEQTRALRKGEGTVFLIGNGASASMASHFAADMAKNARVHTQVFTDPALITAISNDLGYERVFAEPLAHRARTGDMLVAISSSGSSPNILAAADLALELGLWVATLSSFSPDNPLRSRGHLNFYVPADRPRYGDAETCHVAVLHHWMDLMLEEE